MQAMVQTYGSGPLPPGPRWLVHFTLRGVATTVAVAADTDQAALAEFRKSWPDAGMVNVEKWRG